MASHRFSLATSVILALLLTACASAPPEPEVDYKPDYDFTTVRTFSYMQESGATSGNSSRVLISDMQIDRINKALVSAMENKGLQFVEDRSKADLLLTWHLFAEEKQDVRSYNTGPSMGGYYGGYRGYNRMAYYNCWNCGSTEVRVSNYTQGTFIVDLVDPGLNKSVWRSVIQSRMKDDGLKDQAVVNQAAARIMAAFPPM